MKKPKKKFIWSLLQEGGSSVKCHCADWQHQGLRSITAIYNSEEVMPVTERLFENEAREGKTG